MRCPGDFVVSEEVERPHDGEVYRERDDLYGARIIQHARSEG